MTELKTVQKTLSAKFKKNLKNVAQLAQGNPLYKVVAGTTQQLVVVVRTSKAGNLYLDTIIDDKEYFVATSSSLYTALEEDEYQDGDELTVSCCLQEPIAMDAEAKAAWGTGLTEQARERALASHAQAVAQGNQRICALSIVED